MCIIRAVEDVGASGAAGRSHVSFGSNSRRGSRGGQVRPGAPTSHLARTMLTASETMGTTKRCLTISTSSGTSVAEPERVRPS
eukprot:457987-Prorocentrum_minimum.AAC.1